jgi:hypothetical protein
MKYVWLLLWGLAGVVLTGVAEADGSFGRSDLTGTVAADIENYIKGGVFFGNGTGNADSINVFLDVQFNSAQVRCAIYGRTSGAQWQLLDSSAEQTCAVGMAWHNFPLLEHAALSAGTQYALVAWAEQSPSYNCRIRSLESQGVVADSMFFKSVAYGAWPTLTTPTLIWYFDAVLVCFYSSAAIPDRRPASIDEVVHRGAYLK